MAEDEVTRLKKLLHDAEEDANKQRKQKDAALADLQAAEFEIAQLRQQLKEAEDAILEKANRKYHDALGDIEIPFYCCEWVEDHCCKCMVKRLKIPPPPEELPEGYAQKRWDDIGPCDCCTYRSPPAPHIGCCCCFCLPEDWYLRQCTWCPHFHEAWETPCCTFGRIVTLAEREETVSVLPCGNKGLVACAVICPFVVFSGYAPYSCLAALLTVVQQRLIYDTYKLKPDRKKQALNSPETVCCCYCCALWKQLQFLSEMTMFDPKSPFKCTELSIAQLKKNVPDAILKQVEEQVEKGVPGQQKDPETKDVSSDEPSGVNSSRA